MRRVRERYPLFQKIRGNGGGKSRQFHRLCRRGGGSFSNPPPSPSPPRGPVVILSTVSTTVAIFLVFDDPKISSRSHGKIEISPLPSPRQTFQGTIVSTLPLLFCPLPPPLILDFLCMPLPRSLRSPSKEEKS